MHLQIGLHSGVHMAASSFRPLTLVEGKQHSRIFKHSRLYSLSLSLSLSVSPLSERNSCSAVPVDGGTARWQIYRHSGYLNELSRGGGGFERSTVNAHRYEQLDRRRFVKLTVTPSSRIVRLSACMFLLPPRRDVSRFAAICFRIKRDW